MKSTVAITLIICGVVVIAIPALWHAWDGLMMSITLPRLAPNGSVNFGQVPDLFLFACWVLGAAMIGVSVVFSVVGAGTARSARLAVSPG